MNFYVVVIFLTIATSVDCQVTNNAYSCYQCASEELKSRWYLTMLPLTLPDNAFTNCSGIGNQYGSHVSCNGACVTYMIEDPDWSGRHLYVRGCQSSLTLFQNGQYGNNMMVSRFCEYDGAFTRPNSLGKDVQTQILVEKCADTYGNCNNRTLMPTAGGQSCTDSQQNNTVNGGVLSCYNCEKVNGKCSHSKCSKKYCVKSVSKVQGTYSTRKFCMDVNPFGVNEVCSVRDLDVSPFNLNKIGGRSEICFCKDRQNCNSAPTTAFSITLFIGLAIKMVAF